ncbi:hypothetical protein [Brevibacillus dissolubilis]|uniref:hypothetical protein n=1 Tax=Brevibacillus dissolubilis TaxID=1844116 RepID=UPI0011168B3C|nr:hypothetical protein [Brevibacillus dissolubilis]
MAEVIMIKGLVTYSITLDPTVWVFDDRRFDLRTYAGETDEAEDERLAYIRGASDHWERELREGAQLPSERKSLAEERQVLEGDYGVKLAPFIENAKPHPEANYVKIIREDAEPVLLPLEEARKAILQFSKDGKPIRERGPVYFYLPEDLLLKRPPIDNVIAFELINQ